MDTTPVNGSNTTEDDTVSVYYGYTERVIYALIVAIVSIIGTVGNCLVTIAFCINRKLQTKTNVMVINLSVADLISSLNLPWACVALLSEGGWPLPYLICRIEGATKVLTFGCSIYTLGGIAMNRCCLITLPRTRYHDIFTGPHIAMMLLMFWMVPLAVIAVGLYFSTEFFGYTEEYNLCAWDSYHEDIKTFNKILMVVFYPIPLIAISVSSLAIWLFVHHSTKRIMRAMSSSDPPSTVSGMVIRPSVQSADTKRVLHKRQMAVTRNLFFIIAVFFLLTTPFGTLLVIPGGDHLVPLLAVILSCSSCVNPLVYARHPDFKVAFRSLLRCKPAKEGILKVELADLDNPRGATS